MVAISNDADNFERLEVISLLKKLLGVNSSYYLFELKAIGLLDIPILPICK